MWEEVANCPNFWSHSSIFRTLGLPNGLLLPNINTPKYVKVLTCSQIWKFRDYQNVNPRTSHSDSLTQPESTIHWMNYSRSIDYRAWKFLAWQKSHSGREFYSVRLRGVDFNISGILPPIPTARVIQRGHSQMPSNCLNMSGSYRSRIPSKPR